MATKDKLVNLEDLKVVGDVVGDLKTATDELFDVVTKVKSSSFGSGAATAGSKRLLLNIDKPIVGNTYLGELYMVANSLDTTTTVKVELANYSNGTYTVYDSVTESVSKTTTVTQLIDVMGIGKVTSGDTYVFVTFGTGAKFQAASVAGKKMVVGDDIESNSFTTRNVDNYEVDYLIYCGFSSNYAGSVDDSLKYLKTAIGDYEKFSFYAASVASGSFWNGYIDKTVPSGTKVRFELTKYTSQSTAPIGVRAYDANDNYQHFGALQAIGGVLEGTLTLNAIKYRFFTQTTTAVTGGTIEVTYTDDIGCGIASKSFIERNQRVYHVEKDGSGDFTNLADALNVATQWFDSIVYVGAGTWNILDELGETYLSNMSDSQQGIVLKNRVHVICSSKAYIKCLYEGSDADIIDHLSAFNAGPYGFTLENADIEVANVRYCVHDERNSDTDHYDNHYINCRMKNTNTTTGSRQQCIGGGLGYDGHIIIEGCTFENPARSDTHIVSYHNAHGTATDSRSLIEVKGCYFYGSNTYAALYYGAPTVVTQSLVHGNSMGKAPYVQAADASSENVNMSIIAWNNEIRT